MQENTRQNLRYLRNLREFLRPDAASDPEGSAERREDSEHNLKNLFPSFFLHNFLVFLVIKIVINNVLDYVCKGTKIFANHQI